MRARLIISALAIPAGKQTDSPFAELSPSVDVLQAPQAGFRGADVLVTRYPGIKYHALGAWARDRRLARGLARPRHASM